MAEEWRPSYSPWLIAASVMLATFMEVLDTSVASVALPHMAGSLSASVDEATWVLTGYLISNAIVLPSTGWLSNFFGRKQYQIISILAFAAASALCGASTSLPMLITARVIQGAAGGGLQPVSQAVLLESFPREKHGIAMAVYGLGIILAPLLGPTLGGWITDNYSWRWVFYINIPISIVAVLMVQAFVEDPPYARRERNLPIDYIGFGLLALWLGLFQTILDKGQESDWFSADWIRWFAVISAVSMVAFVVHEWRARHPLVDLHVLGDRNLAIGCFLIGLIGIVIYGTTTLLPLFLQDLLDYPAYQSGLAVSPRGIGAIISLIIAARLIGRVDSRWLIAVGLVIRAASLFMLGTLNLEINMWNVIWPNIINGFANGFLFVPLTTLTMGTLRYENMGKGTGLYSLTRNMGASFGISMVTTLLVRGAQRHQDLMVGHLTPYDLAFRQTLRKLDQFFLLQNGLGTSLERAYALIGQILHQQAMLWAYIDDFRLLGFLTLCCLPFLLLFRKGLTRKRPLAAH
ncbi:MAG: DHA2 family efflux MFS transporter permease subunit [Terriglobia bacterium]